VPVFPADAEAWRIVTDDLLDYAIPARRRKLFRLNEDPVSDARFQFFPPFFRVAGLSKRLARPGSFRGAMHPVGHANTQLRLAASSTRTCGESLLELTLQKLGRDVVFDPSIERAFKSTSCGFEADDVDMVGHMLPVRVGITLVFLKRILMLSLPMNQAHDLIIADGSGINGRGSPVSAATTRRDHRPFGLGR
jgi:hypothetical protein